MQTESSAVQGDYGVDVAKDELVVAQAGVGAAATIDNQRGSIARWLRGLPVGSRIAMESTGAYHLKLARLAYEAGMTVYLLNGRDVYHYARALGLRGKTDRVDAMLIARYCAQEHGRLFPYQPPSARQLAIDALVRRRAGVVTQRSALRAAFASGEELDLRAVQPAVDIAMESLDALVSGIDAELARLVALDEVLKQRCARLQSVSGIGLLTSTFLVNLFDRLPFANADALIAYSGLDPRPADSGHKIGRRKLSKRGSAPLRKLMFVCAMAAASSKAFKPFYQSLKARGFAGTQALVILARKLLRVCFAIHRTGQYFDPAKFGLKNA